MGTTAVIECIIKEEVSKVTWFKRCDDKCIKLSTPSKFLNGRPEIPSLTILNTDITDKGIYFCEAENSSGMGRSEDCQVDIQGGKINVMNIFCVLQECLGVMVIYIFRGKTKK